MNNSNLKRKAFSLLNLSIEKKLPLLISLLLIIIITAIAWTSYIGVRRASLEVGRERLKALTEEFSSLFQASVIKIETATRKMAREDIIKNFILNSDRQTAQSKISNLPLSFPEDSLTLSVELYNRNRKLIYSTGKSAVSGAADSSEFAESVINPNLTCTGKFRDFRDSVIYPVITPVMITGKPTGYIVRWRVILSNKNSMNQINALLGSNAEIYLGNADNTLWSNFLNVVPGPPLQKLKLTSIEYANKNNEQVLAQIGMIPNTPWIFLIELSKNTILETSDRFLQWMTIIGVFILLAGFFLAWVMSRNLTKPLNYLSVAAEKISKGDYNAEVDLDREDELGKLAKSFNVMVSEVRSSRNELERKVRERTSQLRAANIELEDLNKKLKELDEIKTNFFTNVSHELRTPLTLILGPLEKLLNDEKTDRNISKDLKIIQRNAAVLLKQVNNLLDLSSLEVGKLKINYLRIDIVSLIRLIASHFETLANDRKINFTTNVPDKLIIEADQEKIERILMNLLSNAFKFTPDNGSIEISVKEKSGLAQFEIKDSGTGIEPGLMNSIFDRFRKGSSAMSMNIGSTGLGLAIVKEFIELHGGNIEVHNDKSGGAVFDLSIPLKAPSGTKIDISDRLAPVSQELNMIPETISEKFSASDPEDKIQGSKKKKAAILVVEDNIAMNNFISDILSDSYIILSAYNGKEAYQKALKHKPDLILSDIMMPVMSGDELIKNLQNNSELAAIPVILLTARSDDKLKIDLLKSGVQEYLIKPFTIGELKVRVDNILKMKMSRDILQKELNKYTDDISMLTEELIEKKRLLESSLAEKEILLKELHHRVKNNLQIIASLLNLQSETVKDAKTLEAFKESQNRIQSMALIHEKLYKSEVFARVNLKEYLDDLVKYILSSYKMLSTSIDVNIRMKNMVVDIDAAISLGLIFCEIMTNSLKHAFSQAATGHINVKFESMNGSGYKLSVHDNGRGFPEGFDIKNSETLGMTIIQTLVEQMEGKIRYKSNSGTEIEIDFPSTLPVEITPV